MSNTKPLVSICIPSYNHGDYIQAALDSILSQTYPNWELIVVDDASPDHSQAILSDYQTRYPDRIRVIIHEENRGISETVNTYLGAAQGEYIACLSSDDKMHPERVARQVAYLQSNQDAGAVCSRIQYIDADDRLIEMEVDVFDKSIQNLRLQMLEGNFLNGPSMMVRTKVFRKVGMHNPALDYVQDYDFWLRMLDDYEIGRLEERLTQYRVHGKNQSVHTPEEIPLAGRYETVFSVFSAMKRWSVEKVFGITHKKDTPEWRRHVSAAKLELARICVRNDQRYFGRSFLGLSQAYTLLAEARGLDPDNTEIEQSLNDAYELMGDAPRAKGERSIPMFEWTDNYDPSAVSAVRDSRQNEQYDKWVKNHSLSEGDAQLMAERMMTQWKKQPSLHLITSFESGQENLLADTIDSLQSQLYKQWGLTVISSEPCPDPVFNQAGSLEWIQYDGVIAEAVNTVVEQSQADWVAYMDAGDQFTPWALFSFADYINLNSNWNLVYCDDDQYGSEGQRVEPRFKPDFNLDLLRSTNYIGGFCLVRRHTLRKVGGFTLQPRVATYDCALKVLDHSGEKSIGHIADVLMHRSPRNIESEQSTEYEACSKVVLTEHLDRAGVNAFPVEGLQPGTWRVKYQHDGNPRVSIIIPTKDQLNYFSICIESILSKTEYENYEVIIVDNGSIHIETQDYYIQLMEAHGDRVSMIEMAGDFNFSAMNNRAAEFASGEYLILLNNDTVVIQPRWIERLLNHAQREDVAIVGARLLYPDQKLQHAGVVLGLQNDAGHPNINTSMSEPGMLNRNQCDQNYSAVTAACLMIQKSIYHEVGGLDEERFTVSFNDVDLCLKATQAGYRIVWTPFTTLVHHGSVSQISEHDGDSNVRRLTRERNALFANWLPQLASDPAWNRNLSLHYTETVADDRFNVHWDTRFKSRPRVLGFPVNHAGCGEYRVLGPLAAMEDQALVQVGYVDPFDMVPHPVVPTLVELERMNPDVLLLQSVVNDAHFTALESYQQFNKAFRVYDLEDLKTIIPEKNSRKGVMFADMTERLERVIPMCHRLTVTTEPLIDAHKHLIDDIQVVPNYLSRAKWGALTSRRGVSEKPRVGWVGAQQHHGDLEILIDVVKKTADEVDWVFFGMCLDEISPYVAEVHDYISYGNYPEKMASLNLDLAVAPLEIHPFNVAKSNLRLLEYGALGWPVVCTDIFPYQDAPVKRVENTTEAWVAAIRERIYDLDATRQEGDALKAWVNQNWFLEDNLHMWMNALTPGKPQYHAIAARN